MKGAKPHLLERLTQRGNVGRVSLEHKCSGWKHNEQRARRPGIHQNRTENDRAERA